MHRESDSTAKKLLPFTDPSTHDLVIRLLQRDFSPERLNQKVLDVPSGSGALSVRMRDLGFEVYCCDIDPGNFEAQGFKFLQADLNQPLPYPNETFDIVVSVAGLQRLYFPEVAIHEFYRILKPGGVLYLSVPNSATLKNRLRFFFYGSVGRRFDSPAYRQTTSRVEANFRVPMMYPRIENLVIKAGFILLDLEARSSLYPYVLFPLTFGVWAVGKFMAAVSAKKYGCYLRNSTPAMLGARAFVIVAKKGDRP